MTITIACVLRTGGRYEHEHVARLYRGCQRHMTTHFKFVCLTNHLIDAPYRQLALRYRWRGWWSKLELFRPDVFTGGRILYIDLDSLIIGDPYPLLSTHRFKMCRDFMGPAPFNSSVMTWDAPDCWCIYERFLQDDPQKIMTQMHGDQNFIPRGYGGKIEQFHPEHVLSYKVDKMPPGPNARIVTFHGDPKPEDCSENWVRKILDS